MAELKNTIIYGDLTVTNTVNAKKIHLESPENFNELKISKEIAKEELSKVKFGYTVVNGEEVYTVSIDESSTFFNNGSFDLIKYLAYLHLSV